MATVPFLAVSREAIGEPPTFTTTPSGRWYRCSRCKRLLPSHEYRACTLAVHVDVECARNMALSGFYPSAEPNEEPTGKPTR